MKTVLITGCSSGYGLETARHFHAQGWNVVATMRTPREDVLPRSDRLRVVALDVTKPESIAAALEASGPIGVLVNNAGLGLMGLGGLVAVIAGVLFLVIAVAAFRNRAARAPTHPRSFPWPTTPETIRSRS